MNKTLDENLSPYLQFIPYAKFFKVKLHIDICSCRKNVSNLFPIAVDQNFYLTINWPMPGIIILKEFFLPIL